MEYENTSGNGMHSNVPLEIVRWNWGAFWFTWIWGIFNKSYISFLAFVPIANFFIPFYLGAKGNELAWRNNEWLDIEEFNRFQRKWAIGGWIFALICVLAITWQVIDKNKQNKLNASITNQIISRVENNKRVKEILGEDYKIIVDSSTMVVRNSTKEFSMAQTIIIQTKDDILFIHASLNEDYSIKTITITLPNEEKVIIE